MSASYRSSLDWFLLGRRVARVGDAGVAGRLERF
jgi:hypothetical protein